MTGGKATGRECEASQAGAASCAGMACLMLRPNQQNKTGICSQRCAATSDCIAGGQCVTVGTIGSICLVPCTSNAECVDGFACVSGGAGVSFCLVDPIASDASTD